MSFRLPSSLPDYRWPAEMTRDWRRRAVGALAFYAGYVLATAFSIRPSRAVADGKRRRGAVLVIRTDGLGDALLFEPALRAIAETFAGCDVHLWAPEATCEMFRGAPYLAERRAVPRGFKAGCLEYFGSAKLRWRMGWLMGRRRFDVAIYPAISPEPMGNWLVSSVRAAERWAVDGDLYNQFDWQKQRTLARATRVAPATASGTHDLIRNAGLLAAWGVAPPEAYPQLPIDANAAAEAKRELQAWRCAQKQADAAGLVGIVPAGSDAARQYPASRWLEVLGVLWREERVMPALLSPPAGTGAGELAGALRTAGIPFVTIERPVSVPGLVKLIGGLEVVVAVDTGPAHFAAAMRVPTVVIRPGTEPGRFFPWPEAPWVVTLGHRVPCEGCRGRCTLAEMECLTKVAPEAVVRAVKGLLRAGSNASQLRTAAA